MTWHGLNVGSLTKRNQHSSRGNQLFKAPRVRTQARDTLLFNPCLDHVEINTWVKNARSLTVKSSSCRFLAGVPMWILLAGLSVTNPK